MTDSSSQQHAGPREAADRPAVPEPSYAERARTLMYIGRIGTLSTLSQKQPGFPFGSMMPYGLDASGRPTFLISTMAMHTQNLVSDPRASLLVTEPELGGNPLGAARVTLIGKALTVPEHEVKEVRSEYLARYEQASYWVDFKDFHFYRLEIVDVYYVGGFGVMGWVTAAEYADGRPDPLADSAPEIIRHMNDDHADALVLLGRRFAAPEVEQATMTAVDRLGFHLRLTSGDRVHGTRIGFPAEVTNTDEARIAFVEMLREVRRQP
jgi:putative heme iron utilization protein